MHGCIKILVIHLWMRGHGVQTINPLYEEMLACEVAFPLRIAVTW